MASGMMVDMRDGLVKRIDHFDADFKRQIFHVPVIVSSMHKIHIIYSSTFDDVVRAFIGMHFDAGFGERRSRFRQEGFGDVLVHEEFLGGIAYADALGFWH